MVTESINYNLLTSTILQVTQIAQYEARTVSAVSMMESGVRCPLGKCVYRGADKSLARPERKQTTATEDFEFHISYL